MFNSSLNNGAGDNIGTIKAFAGSTAPAGWLICDGSAIDRVLYGALFNVIGETYGPGDGSTTFNLPDMLGFTKSKVIIGNGKSLGYTNGTYNFSPSTNQHSATANDYIYNQQGYNTNVGSTPSITTVGSPDKATIGLVTDTAKSGLITANKAAQESSAIIKY